MSTVNVNRVVDASGGVLAPISSVMRNRLINSAMVIDQRNSGASVTATTSNLYTVDRWQAFATQSSKYTVQQNAGSVTPPAGFTNYLGVTSSAATSVGASDFYLISQGIEGYNFADLDWGTANAKTITISFWVRSSLTGTFGSSLTNGSNRSYPFTYTISSANTWEQKSVTIAGDTTGTWNKTNTAAAFLFFSLGAGATWSATAGSWQAGNFLSPTGAQSVVGTNGATFYITGVQLEVGTQATSFEYRQYQQELALCQRYYERISGTGSFGAFCSGSALSTAEIRGFVPLRVLKRATPTATFSAAATFTAQGTTVAAPSSISAATLSPTAVYISAVGTYTAGQGYFLLDNGTTAAFIAADSEL